MLKPTLFTVCLTVCNILLLHAQPAPGVLWQKSLGGNGDDKAYSIVRSTDGGYVIAGSSLSNDGDVTGHHGSTSNTDAWLVKLNSGGAIQWQKSLGGSGDEEIDRMINTLDGGYIGVGFSTSNDGDVSGNHGGRDVWVVKTDRRGIIQWQRSLGGSSDEQGYNIQQTADSGYILSGNTYSRDGDVSSSGSISGSAVWVIRLDKSGNLQWQRIYGGSGPDFGYDIIPLVSGGYIVAVGAEADDGDFSGVGGSNPPNPYLAKISATGDILQKVWLGQRSSAYGLKKISEDQYFALTDLNSCYPGSPNFGFAIQKFDTAFSAKGTREEFSYCDIYNTVFGYRANSSGSMILRSDGTGIVAGTTSDMSSSLHNHGGPTDGVLANFSAATWRRCYGGSGDDRFQGAVADDDYTFIVSGFSNSNDGDVSGNHGGYDFWVVKLGDFNTIKGTVFLDYNGNGSKDGGEPVVNNVLVKSTKGSAVTGSLTYNGVFSNIADTGTYTTQVLSPLPYYTPVPAAASSVFSTFNNTDSLSFALEPVAAQRDYSVSLYALSKARPGFDLPYYLQYVNTGTDTLKDRTVRLIMDARLSLVSASPAAGSVSGDTLLWTVHSLAPRDTGSISIQLHVAAPPAVNLGDTLLSTAVIDSTGDLHAADNLSVLRQGVVGSFDPNDKMEANGGKVPIGDVTNGKALVYTIRFQNTGTDTAFGVKVRDTLSGKVDPATLEMVAASHPYHLSIKNGNILEWVFPGIQLPDSTHHEATSHGYVVYRIKAAAGVATGDSILNKASIYFDFNQPVATRTDVTVVSNITLPSPPGPDITGQQTHYCPTMSAPKIRITNIPAPSYKAVVSVKVDGAETPLGGDSTFSIRPDTLATGVHVLQVTYLNATGANFATWQFNVDAAATPAVDLGSNITTVVNLTQQVVLTATNTAGGGSSPLYTFAKDHGFTNILRAEGAANTFSIDPSTLQVGENTLYVRMKTSASCYTAATGIDSVVITRSSVTGLVDIDNPGQVINISPNPFSSRVYITGLQPAKTYAVSLLNSNGQVIVRKQVSGQQEAVLYPGVLSHGMYLLRIYDLKKNRLIGSAKLLSAGK